MSEADRLQKVTAPLRHGLYARSSHVLQLRNRRVRALARRARERMPWLDAADEPTLRAWCELEILAAGVFVALQATGVQRPDESRKLLDALGNFDRPSSRTRGISG